MLHTYKRLIFPVLCLVAFSTAGQVYPGSNAATPDNDSRATFPFESSNLPIVIINTNGRAIPDDPKIAADFSIIDNGPGIRNAASDKPAFTGKVGIEIRGSSSQMFPKKSYGFETWDALNNSIDTTILGMPAESDWILNANYNDKTFCRNVLACQAWINMGHYGTRYHFCEVLINGEYKGIYILSEKIKRNKSRVNITKLKPDQNTGDALTGGYIFKIDKMTGSGGEGWTSKFLPAAHGSGQTIYFQYEYPKSTDITIPQKTYIQDYVNTFESVLAGPAFADTLLGFRKYAVEATFIDYLLLNEVSKNVDGYRLSTFLNRERDSKGGRLRMGPVWDYDIAWHNADYCGGNEFTGWAYQFPCTYDYWQVPTWWDRMMQDPLFKNRLKCRWLSLRKTVLSDAAFDHSIDSVSALLNEAQQRNFVTWPILGVYVWPNPWPYASTYGGEIASLRLWIHQRLTWMDAALPGICLSTGISSETVTEGDLKVFPVPCKEELNIRYTLMKRAIVHWELCDAFGRIIQNQPPILRDAGVYLNQINTNEFPPGIYFLKLAVGEDSRQRRVVKF